MGNMTVETMIKLSNHDTPLSDMIVNRRKKMENILLKIVTVFYIIIVCLLRPSIVIETRHKQANNRVRDIKVTIILCFSTNNELLVMKQRFTSENTLCSRVLIFFLFQLLFSRVFSFSFYFGFSCLLM